MTMKMSLCWLPLVCATAWMDETARAAEPSAVISVWPGKAPGETTEFESEVTQPAKPDEKPPTTRLTNISRPTLHLFLPPKEKRNGTSVVICPGGGFRILA